MSTFSTCFTKSQQLLNYILLRIAQLLESRLGEDEAHQTKEKTEMFVFFFTIHVTRLENSGMKRELSLTSALLEQCPHASGSLLVFRGSLMRGQTFL
jgi:hypothetical protein